MGFNSGFKGLNNWNWNEENRKINARIGYEVFEVFEEITRSGRIGNWIFRGKIWIWSFLSDIENYATVIWSHEKNVWNQDKGKGVRIKI